MKVPLSQRKFRFKRGLWRLADVGPEQLRRIGEGDGAILVVFWICILADQVLQCD